MKLRKKLFYLAVVILALAAFRLFQIRCPLLRQPREKRLSLDLFKTRIAIEDYTIDKERGPRTLQELVDTHYLSEIPVDPFTQKDDWIPEIGDPRAGVVGPEINSVHSASDEVGCNGYATRTGDLRVGPDKRAVIRFTV
jgi:general secretion pathway protein G